MFLKNIIPNIGAINISTILRYVSGQTHLGGEKEKKKTHNKKYKKELSVTHIV